MRVLGIVCSPREGGNTEILVREALESIREAGGETVLFCVHEKIIAPCNACDSCKKTGICKIKDDMHQLYDEMIKADAILIGTPSYFTNVSAQAKAIIDRTYAFSASRKLRGKVAGAIVASRRTGVGQVLAILYSFFTTQRMVIAGGSAGYGLKKGDVKNGLGIGQESKAVDEARALGRAVIRMVNQMAK